MAKVVFDPTHHTYTLNGVQAVSVTRVLDHAGLVDSSHFSRHAGEDFLLRGNVIHDLTAKIDRGEQIDKRGVVKRWRGFLDAWELFKKQTGWVSKEIEYSVCCHDPLYAGTLDRIGRFPESKLDVVLDLKNHNSGRVGNHVRYQLVAYGHAYNPKKVFDRVGVALHPDGTYGITRFALKDYIADLDQFLYAVRKMYDAQDFLRSMRPRTAEQLNSEANNIAQNLWHEKRRNNGKS